MFSTSRAGLGPGNRLLDLLPVAFPPRFRSAAAALDRHRQSRRIGAGHQPAVLEEIRYGNEHHAGAARPGG